MPYNPTYKFSTFGIAVNQVLSYAQLQPMSDDDTTNVDEDNAPASDDLDVVDAYNLLNQVSTTIQQEGYPFNTIYGHKISPTIAGLEATPGNIILPNKTLKFLVPKKQCGVMRQQTFYTRQGNLLYDNIKETDLFDEAIELDITLGLKFMDLLPAVRNYITATAGIQFQINKLGSDSLMRQQQLLYAETKRSFERYIHNMVQANMLNNTNYILWDLTHRRTYLGC